MATRRLRCVIGLILVAVCVIKLSDGAAVPGSTVNVLGTGKTVRLSPRLIKFLQLLKDYIIPGKNGKPVPPPNPKKPPLPTKAAPPPLATIVTPPLEPQSAKAPEKQPTKAPEVQVSKEPAKTSAVPSEQEVVSPPVKPHEAPLTEPPATHAPTTEIEQVAAGVTSVEMEAVTAATVEGVTAAAEPPTAKVEPATESSATVPLTDHQTPATVPPTTTTTVTTSTQPPFEPPGPECYMQSECEVGCCYTLTGEILWDHLFTEGSTKIGYCEKKPTTSPGMSCHKRWCPCQSTQKCMSVPDSKTKLPAGFEPGEGVVPSDTKCYTTKQVTKIKKWLKQLSAMVDYCRMDSHCPLRPLQ